MNEGIAVIGYSGRFPGAPDVEAFWKNLSEGVETITRFSPEETEFSVGRPDAADGKELFVRARGLISDADLFDAGFFGIYPKEAAVMDPQHRIFLECAWEAAEASGYDPTVFPGMIGVYAGASLNTYLLYNLGAAQGRKLAGNYQVGEYTVMLGNDKDFLPVRVAYKLNLRGPVMAVQSACSSSLVAICQACSALQTWQCDMALAGGVSITFPQMRDYRYVDEGMVSPDGTCRSFDAGARGTVFGHGCGVVMLKRFADAVADRDIIHAVLKGWAVNNDGAEKIGFAAPGVQAQADVIAYALDSIAGCIQDHKVTTLWLTSGLFQAMVDDHLDELAGLRNLLAGGDVLSIPHLRRAMAALPGTRFINGYGPTENTTFTTCHTIQASDLHLVSVPIGKPIANTRVFILDEKRRMVPVGVPGEIYTGGDGLAIGYLNDKERTESAFLEAAIPGVGRLYRTGDRGCWREDGTVCFLGRRDRQVKIRGVRVEPGEVEAALIAHPNIAECHVGTRGRSASSKVLVAWVRPSGTLDREQVMDFLAAKLPAFLRPDAIVPVERFPLTGSGKLDMSALPDPDVSARTKSAIPETATEKQLAAIWSDLLGVSDIRRDDNFFYLGGHSLLALRLFSRIRNDFGMTLPLATLLRAPSLRMLGSFLDRELSEGNQEGECAPVLAVIHAEGAGAPLFCIHAGDGGILVYKELMHHLDGGRPVLGIESPGLRAGADFQVPTIEETAALYLKTIRRRQPHGPYLLAGLSYGGTVAYEMAVQLQEEGEEVAFLALFDTWAPGVRMIKVGLRERLRRYHRRKAAGGPFEMAFQTAVYFLMRAWQRVFPQPEALPEPDSNDLQRELREAHGETMRTYRPRPYPGKLTLFRAMDPGGCVFDFPEDNGWTGLVDELEIIPADGTHDTLFDCRHISGIGKKLQARLQDCRV